MSDWHVAWAAWKGSDHRKLTGHTGEVNSVAIGKVAGRDVIVSAGSDWTLRFWDPVTGEPIGPHIGTDAGPAGAMALGQVGGRDVVACACGRFGFQDVRIWDAVTREPTGPPLPGRASSVIALALGRARGRDVIACADRIDRTVRVWDAVTGQPVGRPAAIPHGWPALTLARAGRRDVLVVAVGEPSVYDPARKGAGAGYAMTARIHPRSGKLIGRPRRIHDGGIQPRMAMTYEPARGLVLCAGQADDGMIRIWDASTGRAIGQPPDVPGAPKAFGRIAGRLILVSHGREGTRFWDVFTGEQVRHPVTHDSSPQVVSVGRVGDRDIVVYGCRDYLEVMDWTAEDHPFGHTDSVVSLAGAIVRDRAMIISAAACDDDAAWVWDAATGRPAGPSLTSHDGSVDALATGRAGDRDVIVTAVRSSVPPGGPGWTAGQIRIWDPVSGAQIGDPIPCDGDVAALAVSRVRDRDLIVSAASDGVVTWDAVTREVISRLPFGAPVEPRALALARSGPDVTILCAAALDRRVTATDSQVIVYAWDAATGQPASDPVILGGVASRSALAFGQVGNRSCVVCMNDRYPPSIKIFDASDGNLVRPPLADPAAKITALAAGRAAGRDVVVAGGDNGTVTLWDVVAGEPIGEPLTAHDGAVRAVTLTRLDGRDYVISGGIDRKVICWATE